MRSYTVQAPRTGVDDVRKVIREELGEYPETLWKSFDPEPIASASLAQVHRAVGWDGEQLAVKVRFLLVSWGNHPGRERGIVSLKKTSLTKRSRAVI